MWEAHDQHFRRGAQRGEHALQVVEELRAGAQRRAEHAAPCQTHAVDVDRKGRRRHDRDFSRVHEGQEKVREALLAADRADHLLLRIQLHCPFALVESRHFPFQVEDAFRAHAVAVVLGIAHGLAELLDNRLWGGVVGVSHPQVNHVFSGLAARLLEGVDAAEHVGGQFVDAL